ncbi:PLD nuclease N-terminal domain-containing protein [Candidatus Sulfidibacterium hydrothermale]|uniref:PLDc N-terminal domain-containing protein n=1 Tax=Candidatus Sulfidibacterium hydrothermale TaxID=2875962 RepID=UPI001F0A0B7F|nr:PLD nuclease N-terminal domain-containing protein [Candidatus Sulfidibacterium hydrothermale]UBM61561.1 PLD nuclease N-terminal domain-containing protein [Candidatus Sulfidibacterium hydrothermale]
MNYLMIVFLLLILALEFWALIDLTRSRFKTPIMRTVYLLIVLFFPVLGTIAYFLTKKSVTTKESRRFQPEFKS